MKSELKSIHEAIVKKTTKQILESDVISNNSFIQDIRLFIYVYRGDSIEKAEG